MTGLASTSQTSRRAMIAGLAMLPAATVAGGHSMRISEGTLTSLPDRGLTAAIVAFRQASKDLARHDQDVCRPAREAYDAACESIPPQTVSSYKNVLNEGYTPTTADPSIVAIARRFVMNGRSISDPQYSEAMIALAKAADERDAERGLLFREFRIGELVDESDRLSHIQGDKLDVAIEYPVTTTADMLTKVELIREVDAYDTEYLLPILIADLKRIEGRA